MSQESRVRSQEGELEGGKNSIESGNVTGYGLRQATLLPAALAINWFLMVSTLIPYTLFTFSTPETLDLYRFSVYMA
jgi:hypothetical protein